MTGRRRAVGVERRSDERGAVAVLVAASMVLVLAVAALAVDLGMQRVLRRDLQALADVAALDLARLIPGKKVSELNAAAPAVVARVVARNRDTLGDSDATTNDDPVVTFVFGKAFQDADGSTGFDPGSLDSFPNAVKTIVSNEVGFVFGVGDGGATGSAIAMTEGGACFGIGSYAAQLDTSTSPLLGRLLGALGTQVSLTALDYQALAGVEVDLLSLVGVKVGAVTLEELIAGDELVSLGDFYVATATVLARESGTTAAVNLLQTLGLAVAPLNLKIPIADLLSLGTGGASGLDVGLNVLDLVTAGASAASSPLVSANGLALQAGVNLGPIANVTTSLSVIEPPKVGCGRKNDVGASAESSAVRLNLSATALDIELDVGLVDLDTRVALDGSVGVASATGRLTDVRCNPEGITVRVEDGLLAVDLALEVEISVGILDVIRGPIKITGQSPSSGDAVINIDEDSDYDSPVTVANSSSGLPELNVDVSELELLTLDAGKILDKVLGPLLSVIVNPLVSGLDALVLTPLLRLLGLDLSGADVFAKRVPTCDNATLRG